MSHSANFKQTLLASLISLCCMNSAYASAVRNDINYQYFRDFAENKGQFSVGATNIPIYNTQGHLVGTMLSNNTPMPDLHAASRDYAIATLNAPQYLSSVKHNGGYPSVAFGHHDTGEHSEAHHFTYFLVDRNDHPHYDYHTPRLHKLVTEVAPLPLGDIPYNKAQTNPQSALYKNKQRFTQFVRLGSGTQYLRNPDNSNVRRLSGAYFYLTGGAALNLVSTADYRLDLVGSVANSDYGPMATYGMPGDSGSPLLAYDAQEKRWVVAAVLSSYSGDTGWANSLITSRPDFLKKVVDDDEVNLNYKNNTLFNWQLSPAISDQRSAISTIMPQNSSASTAIVNLFDESKKSQDNSQRRPSLENGKTLHLTSENSTLILKNTINQGAGALYFHSNFTVKPDTNQQWQGAGIAIDEGKTVNWQVSNPANDRLSKIGQGTLYVNGSGRNDGSISVGDGKVILAQRADQQGNKQAFNEVGIVSGRATVTLNDAQQVNPNNIYFGFRGGRLDVNGNSLTFSHIQNVDEGAMVVNQDLQRTANVAITAGKKATAQDIEWRSWSEQPKTPLALYEYNNTWKGNRKDYFVLKYNPNTYFPTEANSNYHWEYVGSNKQKAIQTVLDRYNATVGENVADTVFNGYFGETDIQRPNGRLNVLYNTPDSTLNLISGGVNIDGTMSVLGGDLLLSGRPVPHARDKLNNREVILDNEWLTRSFKADEFQIRHNSTLYTGRDVSQINGNFTAKENAKVQLGFIQGQTPICVRSDYTGKMQCNRTTFLTNTLLNSQPNTQIKGDITLTDNAQLHLGKSQFFGSISGTRATQVNLHEYSHWTVSQPSTVGQLNLDRATITLNPQFETANTQTKVNQFNSLTINGNLSGIGRFDYLLNVAESKGDNITVNGQGSGIFELVVKNTGQEPNAVSPLSLINFTQPQSPTAHLSISLHNGYADLGAYRYILKKFGTDYRLYSPVRDIQTHTNLTNKQTYEEALKEIDKKVRETEQITQEANVKRQIMQEAERELANIDRDVRNAQSRYFNAQTIANKYRNLHFFFIKRSRALESLKKAEYWLNTAKLAQRVQLNDLNSKTQALNETLALLEQAKQSLKEAEQYAEQLKIYSNQPLTDQDVREQAYKLCQEANNSNSVCNQVIQKISADESDFAVAEFNRQANNAEIADQQLQQAEQAFQQALQAVKNAEKSANAQTIAKAKADLERQTLRLAQARVDAKEAQQKETEALLALYLAKPDSRSQTLPNGLTQANWISAYTNTALSELSAQTNAIIGLEQHLDRHLLTNNSAENSVWSNVATQKTQHHSHAYRHYQQDSTLTQVGVEKAIHDNLRIGAVLSHSLSNNDFDDQYSGKQRLTGINAYLKAQNENGGFATVDLGYAHSHNQLQQGQSTTKFQRHLHSVGVNIGKEWQTNGFTIQPSLGVRYHHLSATHYQLEQAKINSEHLNLISYTAGVKLAKTFEVNGIKLTPTLASYWTDTPHRINHHAKLQVNGHTFNQSVGHNLNYEASINAQYHRWTLQTNLGMSKGNESGKQHFAGLKISYKW